MRVVQRRQSRAAASVFSKTFGDPIEQTILPSNDLRQTFINAEGARNIGFELEARRSLARFTRRLREFSVSSQFTYVDSNIDIRLSDVTLLTSSSRPLLGQSRCIFNLIGEWSCPAWRSDARFYMNRVARRITDVGTFGVPDIHQEGKRFSSSFISTPLQRRTSGFFTLKERFLPTGRGCPTPVS